MSDATCIVKNRSNEDMAARREYGCPVRRGIKSYNPYTGVTEHNTDVSDWNIHSWADIETQKKFYKNNLENIHLDWKFVEFLQDRFYRMYKGYPVNYYELPLDDPKRMELYNHTALDCGHPEYMVDSKGNPLKICDPAEKAEPEENTRLAIECKPASSKEENVVDVVDADGNVVAENVGTAKPAESKKPKSKPDADSENKDSKAKIKKDVVSFDPSKIKGNNHEKDNPDRADDYKQHNEKVLAMYSDQVKEDLAKFIHMCTIEGRVVRLDNMKGLVLATIYAKNVPEAIDCTVIKRAIDPGKIRNGCYVLTEDPDMILSNRINPFTVVGIKVGDPCLRNYLFESALVSDVDWNRLWQENGTGSAFYRYISYNSFENDELVHASDILFELCRRLMQLNLGVRFKVLNKKSINEFDLVVTENVGLGYYVPGNKDFVGLTVHVQYNNGLIYYIASGKNAEKFASLVNNPTPIVYIEKPFTEELTQSLGKAIDKTIEETKKINHKAEVKANAKKIDPKKGKKQTAEIPAGRK